MLYIASIRNVNKIIQQRVFLPPGNKLLATNCMFSSPQKNIDEELGLCNQMRKAVIF